MSGPGAVTFAQPKAAGTTALFSAGGVYQLKLTVSDGALSDSDVVTIRVNKAPVVKAGLDRTITLPNKAALTGSGNDDGLPNPPGALTYTWSKVSGPGAVTFAKVHGAKTSASFGRPGAYTLRLTASDRALTGQDTLVVHVKAAPAPAR